MVGTLDRLIIVGNYPLDHQQSMERFSRMLRSGAEERGLESEIWRPEVLFARRHSTSTSGLAKWLGYIDKWIYYPIRLRRKVKELLRNNPESEVFFHIADHSNAYYLSCLPAEQTGITCHDVLAIRGALGDEDTYCPASGTGRILQAWILKHLKRAKKLAAVSETTLTQLQNLANLSPKESDATSRRWTVILNGFNDKFWPMPAAESAPRLQNSGVDPSVPFLLHVGSALPRKNRAMLLAMVAKAGSAWKGNVVFAGAAMDSELQTLAEEMGLSHRVIEVVRPPHETLVALYSSCFAFAFPSFSEGFGWPLIEAQACGAPVIASDRQPMPEVSGGTAIHACPNDPKAFADAIIELLDYSVRLKRIEAGYRNCQRFQAGEMVDRYLDLHAAQ